MNNYIGINEVLLPTLLSSELLLFLPSMSRLRHFWKRSVAKPNKVWVHMPLWHAISSFDLTRFHPHDHCFLSAILYCNQLRSIADILLADLHSNFTSANMSYAAAAAKGPKQTAEEVCSYLTLFPSTKLLEALKSDL
jgi:hypothetical protein